MKKKNLTLAGMGYTLNVLPISLTTASISETTAVVIAASVAVAVVMIMFHGFKWMTAENPEDAKQAKEGIKNVLAGLLILIVAATLVDLVYTTKPSYT